MGIRVRPVVNDTAATTDVLLSNTDVLLKITEAGGLPLWNGDAWPGGGDGGNADTLTLTDTSNGKRYLLISTDGVLGLEEL